MIIRTWITAAAVIWAMANVASAQHKHDEHDHSAHQQSAETMPEKASDAATDGPASSGPHGGQMQVAGTLQLETVVEPGGLQLFAYNAQGKPLDVQAVRGVATLQVAGDAKRYRYDLFPEIRQDKSAESLGVAVDLSKIAGRKVELSFQLMGLVAGERQPMRLDVSAEVPMTEAQQVAAAIAEQKICPVSGQPLGSMGGAIPVSVGDDTIYVCCAGCVGKVKADFPKYLAMLSGSTGAVPPGSEEVRPGVFKTVAADQPFIKAQQKCPVMDEPLGGMGAPLKVHANGKAIYICCAGCAKKIQAEPGKYLQLLAEQGVTAPSLQSGDAGVVAAGGEAVRPGVFKVTADEAAFVAAQKLCPVMDEPLDGMGGPYRVNIEGRAVYICCPGCAKKLHAEPSMYLEKLAKQGVTPPVLE